MGISFCAGYIKKYSKILAIIFIIGILLFGAYQEYKQADPLIKSKETSYLQMKQAFEWIKANTPKENVIVGSGIEPYAVYYADREYTQLLFDPSNVSLTGGSDY